MNKRFLSIMLLVSLVNFNVVFGSDDDLINNDTYMYKDPNNGAEYLRYKNYSDSELSDENDSSNGDYAVSPYDMSSESDLSSDIGSQDGFNEEAFPENDSFIDETMPVEEQQEGKSSTDEVVVPAPTLKAVAKDLAVGGVKQLYSDHKEKAHKLAGKALKHTGKFAARGAKKLLNRFKNRNHESEKRSLSKELPSHHEMVSKPKPKRSAVKNHESENRSLSQELPFHHERVEVRKTHEERNHEKKSSGKNGTRSRKHRMTNRR